MSACALDNNDFVLHRHVCGYLAMGNHRRGLYKDKKYAFSLILVFRSHYEAGCSSLSILLLGDYCGEVTPVPIPNTVVKLSSADDTG